MHRAIRCRAENAQGLRLIDLSSTLLTDAAVYRRMSEANNPYGDGLAAARVIDAILAFVHAARS